MTFQPPLQFGDPVANTARQNADKFRDGFCAWLASNRHVWRAFEREANRIWARGRRHYSARTICEVLRHESALAEVGSEFKIDNNCAPDLARLYALVHPERAGFFQTRLQAGSERAA